MQVSSWISTHSNSGSGPVAPTAFPHSAHTYVDTFVKPGNVFTLPQCGHVAVAHSSPEQALQDIHLDHAHHGPALVAAEFHVGAIDGGDDAAATIDASSLVGDDGHPAGEVVAEVGVHH